MARMHIAFATIAVVLLPQAGVPRFASTSATAGGGPRVTAPLVVHEWGTITTRHAPDGTPEGRLNHIDSSEVLPPFVHRYEPPPTRAMPRNTLLKTAIEPGRPDVTMRLETPVIYFHVPAGERPEEVPPFSVGVRFRGGVLNEFYPDAAPSVAIDFDRVTAKMQAGVLTSWDGSVLNNYVVGGLRWTNLILKDSVSAPRTASSVWLAPRQVKSSAVMTGTGEAERYLFYRGVAHLDALMRTELGPTAVRLLPPATLIWLAEPAMTVPAMWLVEVRGDGRVAFRKQDRVVISKAGGPPELARLELLTDGDFGPHGLAALRRSMRHSLIDAGLFDDEADAMLETWKASYFGAPGLRLLYVVPREWTDYFLPLELSAPHTLTRVLVGRIDLIK
jgi:hypothetical protein